MWRALEDASVRRRRRRRLSGRLILCVYPLATEKHSPVWGWHCWRRGEERKEGKMEREGWREGEPLPLPEIKLSPSWRFFMSAAGLICHMSQEST